MKQFISFVLSLIVLSVTSCRDEKRYHDEHRNANIDFTNNAIEEILQFQEELNATLRDPELSPLLDRYRKNFKGLDFFVPDTSFRVMAYLERTPETLPFLMPTTTDRKALERVYGIARFTIEQNDYQLELYQNLELLEEEGLEDYLFLPFTDKTSYRW